MRPYLARAVADETFGFSSVGVRASAGHCEGGHRLRDDIVSTMGSGMSSPARQSGPDSISPSFVSSRPHLSRLCLFGSVWNGYVTGLAGLRSTPDGPALTLLALAA